MWPKYYHNTGSLSTFLRHLVTIGPYQKHWFGFRFKYSCESQLLVTVNNIARALYKLQVDAAILDFSKAFDKVAHKHLIYKLDYYGIRGNLLNWLTSFLQNRSQEVVVTHPQVMSHRGVADSENLKKMLPGIPINAIGTVFLLCRLSFCGFFDWHVDVKEQVWYGEKKWKDPKIIFTTEDLIQCGIGAKEQIPQTTTHCQN